MCPDPPIAANIELPQAVRCLSNCGFYGSIAKGRLCNKCYDDLQAQSKVRHNHLARMRVNEVTRYLHCCLYLFKRIFTNDEAIRYLLDLANLASLKEVALGRSYCRSN